jgi:hypothetical protein
MAAICPGMWSPELREASLIWPQLLEEWEQCLPGYIIMVKSG